MKKLPAPTADTPSFEKLVSALNSLETESPARWGTMNAPQMVKHCREFIDLYMGRVPTNFVIRILARMIGGLFLKKVLQKSPMDTPKNLGTIPAIKAKDDGLDLEAERKRLFEGFEEIQKLEGQVDHPLYGKTAAEDIQALVRHHTAHHANQFGLIE